MTAITHFLIANLRNMTSKLSKRLSLFILRLVTEIITTTANDYKRSWKI